MSGKSLKYFCDGQKDMNVPQSAIALSSMYESLWVCIAHFDSSVGSFHSPLVSLVTGHWSPVTCHRSLVTGHSPSGLLMIPSRGMAQMVDNGGYLRVSRIVLLVMIHIHIQIQIQIQIYRYRWVSEWFEDWLLGHGGMRIPMRSLDEACPSDNQMHDR